MIYPKIKKNRKSKIASRTSNLDILLLVSVLALMAILSFIIISNINSENSENLVRVHSLETARLFYSYMSEDLSLVRKAAHSRVMTSWFADEGNPEKKNVAFDEIMDYVEIVPDPYFYIAIDETGNEYTVRGISEPDNFVPFSRLDPLEPGDFWYFECITISRIESLSYVSSMFYMLFLILTNRNNIGIIN